MIKVKMMISENFYKNKFPGSTGKIISNPIIELSTNQNKIRLKSLALMVGHYADSTWVCPDGKNRVFLRI